MVHNMNDSITCPNCKRLIPLTEAISHQIDEKYKQEIAKITSDNNKERERLIELSKKRTPRSTSGTHQIHTQTSR